MVCRSCRNSISSDDIYYLCDGCKDAFCADCAGYMGTLNVCAACGKLSCLSCTKYDADEDVDFCPFCLSVDLTPAA